MTFAGGDSYTEVTWSEGVAGLAVPKPVPFQGGGSLIDVSDVLFDPLIAGQTFTILRRRQEVNARGEGIVTVEAAPIVGSITPTGDNSLTREVAFGAQNQSIQVITTYRLRGQTKEPSTGRSFLPDLVLWHSDYYVVMVVDDYTPYGAGFVRAEAVSYDYQEVPAQNVPAQVGKVDFSQAAQSGLVPLLTGESPEES